MIKKRRVMSDGETAESAVPVIPGRPEGSRCQGTGKSRWRKLALFTLWAVVLIAGIAYIMRYANLSVILSQPWSFWALQAALLLVYLVLAAVLNVIVLQKMEVRCALPRVFLILQTSYSGSYLGPLKLGVPLRVFLFKKMLGTSYSTAVSATAAAQGIRLGALVLVAIVGVGVKFHDYYVHLLIALGALVIAVLVSLLILRLARLVHVQQRLLERSRRFLVSVYESMMRVGVRAVVRLGVLSVALMMLLSSSSFLIINQFGEHLSFLDVFFIDAISVFVGFVSFVPMGLGTRDATSIFLLSQAGAPQDIVYSIILVQRMIWSLLPFTIGLVSANILGVGALRQKNESPVEECGE